MRVVRIRISGIYKVPFNNPFTATAVVMPVELSDSMRDEVLKKYTAFNVLMLMKRHKLP